MEQIFAALPGIILRALPTTFLIILLHWYFKKVLVQPLERTLEQRRRKTAGSVEASEHTLALAAEKMKQYEQSLADARTVIFEQQESTRKDLASKQMAALEVARQKSAERVAAARAEIMSQAQQAKAALEAESDRLADQVANTILAGGVQ